MGRTGRRYMILILIPVIILFGQCSPRVNKSMLTIFFDGVPQADTLELISSAETQGLSDTSSVVFASGLESSSGQIIHYPYQERECAVCHDEKSLGSMVQPEPDLCYQCHEDFSDTYDYVHGPVAGGYCTACHNPHMSEEKSLLRFSGQQLCLNCHNPGTVLKNEMHEDLGDMNCTECHNPHGGEDRFIFY